MQGRVVGIAFVTGNDQLMLITQQGQILRIDTGSIRVIGRATQGVCLIDLSEGDAVVSMARVPENGDESNGNGDPNGDPETTSEPDAPEPQDE